MALKVSSSNGVKVYNCTAGKSTPQWYEDSIQKKGKGRQTEDTRTAAVSAAQRTAGGVPLQRRATRMPPVRPLQSECAVGRMHGHRCEASSRRSLGANERLLQSAHRMRRIGRSAPIAWPVAHSVQPCRSHVAHRASCVSCCCGHVCLCVQADRSVTMRISDVASI